MRCTYNGCKKDLPATGRARDKGLCCKHDRMVFGKQTLEEKGTKILERLKRRQERELLTVEKE